MKLHEAIKEGLTKTKPLKKGYFDILQRGTYASVLGAAFFSESVALNTQPTTVPEGLRLARAWPILDQNIEDLSPAPPIEILVKYEGGIDFWDAIVWMNDNSDLTREKINEWIKQVEETLLKDQF